MANDISTAQLQTIQFTDNLRLKLQQRGSRLRGRVMEGNHAGSKQAQVVDYMAPTTSKPVTGRGSPIVHNDQDFQRRWVVPASREVPQLFDTFDKLKQIEDPQSQAVTNAANAMGRDWDDTLIAAAFADATISTADGGTTLTTESFSTTNYGVSEKFGDGSTAVGATVEKLIEANRIFRRYHVDLEDMEGEARTWIIASKQESDLLKLTEVVSREYNDRPVLVDGKVTRFMGYDLMFSERLGYGTGIGTTANCRKTIVFVKSGLYLGMWQDMFHDVSQRKDLQGLPWQVYSMHTFGATRLEPGRLLRIDCANDTYGADVVP